MEKTVLKVTNTLDDLIHRSGPLKNLIQMRYVINTFKAGTLPYCLIMMWYFQNFSMQCVVYAALHGSYGLIWILKDCISGDASWKSKTSLTGIIIISFV